MTEVPSAGEIGGYSAVVFAAIGAALVAWRKQSATKLAVKEDASRGDWLKQMEDREAAALEREQRAIEREQRALDREREAVAKMGAMKLRITMLIERLERQDKKMEMLMRIVSAARPDLVEVLTSAWGDLSGPELTDPMED